MLTDSAKKTGIGEVNGKGRNKGLKLESLNNNSRYL